MGKGGDVLSIEGDSDLGFVHTVAKNGNVLINREGKLVTILRGSKAADFAEKMQVLDFGRQQQLMARMTGNYKRGNEKLSRNHLKNRR